MSALARAYKIEEIEADPSLVETADKECFTCDPDNPKGVKRSICPTCGGNGRQKLAVSEIVTELIASKKEEEKASGGDADDLYLEY